jgi:outer membrane autotransporter protein
LANKAQTDAGNGAVGNTPELICFGNGTCGVSATANGFSNGGLSAHGGSVLNSRSYSIKLSAEALRKQAAKAEAAKYADKDSSYSTADLPDSSPSYFDIWAEIHGSKSDNNGIDSNLFAVYLGAHIRPMENLLVGVMTQVDRASSNDPSTSGTVKGTGFMVGPYVVAKLPDHEIYFEGRALWGKTYNDITPVGTYTDRYTSSRFMVRAKVSGDIRLEDKVTIRPEGYLTYYQDKRATYTDSLGASIPGQTVKLGEARLGPVIYKEITLDDGTLLQPRVGVAGVANFAQQNATIGTGGIRARIDSGLNVQTPDGFVFDGSGYYDGIFNSGYQSYGGQASIGKTF